MTVIDFDPPQTRLRLVSSTGAGATRDHRYRAGAQLGLEARQLLREVLASALRAGAPVNADALRVILAAKQANDVSPIRRFTATSIWQLMFVEIVGWCRARHLGIPPDSVEAIRAIIDHLDATESFAPGSDPVAALHAAVDECTGGWIDPEPARVPTGGRRSVRSHRGPKRT